MILACVRLTKRVWRWNLSPQVHTASVFTCWVILLVTHRVVCCCIYVPYFCLYWWDIGLLAIRNCSLSSLSRSQLVSSWSWSAMNGRCKLKKSSLKALLVLTKRCLAHFPHHRGKIHDLKTYSGSNVQRLQSLASWSLCLCRTWWPKYMVEKGCSRHSEQEAE